MRIIAIGDRATTLLCRLAGVEDVIRCEDGEEAKEALREALKDDTIGIILILDRYQEEILPLLSDHGRSQAVYPAVIAIPGPEGPVKGEDAVTAAIRRVAGKGMPG